MYIECISYYNDVANIENYDRLEMTLYGDAGDVLHIESSKDYETNRETISGFWNAVIKNYNLDGAEMIDYDVVKILKSKDTFGSF